MKKIKNKKSIFIFIFLLVISSTVAYLYSTDTFQNIFVAASYKVRVVETFESPDNWKPGDTTPKTATLKNEGTVPIKVRVKLEEEWKDSNNQDLPLQHNDENVAIINFSNEEDYIYRDEYYYYDIPLQPGETTSSIIESVTFNPNYSGTITCVENNDSTHTCSSSEDGYEGGTYKLKITIEGVQEDYYVQAWGLSRSVSRSLYDVLNKRAQNNELVVEYTGEHQDSMDSSKSIEKIYHWYANNNEEGADINNKNNVIFAGHCWNIIRTTDTGGVKMIYNGVSDNNQCLDTRENYPVYDNLVRKPLSNNYWYGTDYTYDNVTKKFKVSGTTEQALWNASTGPGLIGKYTCASTDKNVTCSTLYLIKEYYSSSSGMVLSITANANYLGIGNVQFNEQHNNPSYVGYMYKENNSIKSTSILETENFQKQQTLFGTITGSAITWYYYSDSIDFGNVDANKYSLINPIKGTTDYSSLVGKYTVKNMSSYYKSNVAYYIVGNIGSTLYYVELKNGDLYSDYDPMLIGDSITDNGNNTYTINNPVAVYPTDWFTNYSSYRYKYTCNSNTTVCDNPSYLYYNYVDYYNYVNAGEKILLAMFKNGNTLSNTKLYRKDEWYNNYNTFNSNFSFTCNNDSTSCNEELIRSARVFGNTYYKYNKPYYYGSDVTWDGEKYHLVDPVKTYASIVISPINNHHYVCLSDNTKECSSVAYIFYTETNYDNLYYVVLNDGITSKTILENMISNNTNDSVIKYAIDNWYKKYLLKYDDYLDDIIYCNDRSIRDYGSFDPNKTNSSLNILFGPYPFDDLSCPNITDRFSISNNEAKLKYKIGLLTYPELVLLNNQSARPSGEFWTMSPSSFSIYANDFYAYNRVSISNNVPSPTNQTASVRPAIALKSDVGYSSGNGSKESPYIVKMD